MSQFGNDHRPDADPFCRSPRGLTSLLIAGLAFWPAWWPSVHEQVAVPAAPGNLRQFCVSSEGWHVQQGTNLPG